MSASAESKNSPRTVSGPATWQVSSTSIPSLLRRFASDHVAGSASP
eukprot:CAMPEP_0178458870 /NCGR_PEP_ID=MMETSP0689_2-20121128/47785_1 /TAXON_ID=160604 /ORGANISM="Amphidinium massartii, Strain CS-259" /LENGTH=45 /DNA_ID= /DNA_START= /DNA_END= /DNA_ORIENTATION=